jgi:rod shape-determining protein MreC
MKYIQGDVNPGDKIISSGLGGIYPRGLLIGEVLAVEEEENKLYKIAEIEPAVNLSVLEEVMVVIK